MNQAPTLKQLLIKHYTLENNGVSIVYRMKKPWSFLFKSLGYATKFYLPINNILEYELNNYWHGSQLKLSAYQYKIGKTLNSYKLPTIWGLNRNDLDETLRYLDKTIRLNKVGRNVALSCVGKEQIKDFYSMMPKKAHESMKPMAKSGKVKCNYCSLVIKSS